MTSAWARARAAVGFLAFGCGGGSDGGGSDGGATSARVVQVPEQVATIGEAVAMALPGTIIDIGPGVYHEAVTVETQRVTLRGRDRNTVILDGRFALANGISVKTDDVAVENLTVRNYNQNGIVFNGIAAASGGPVNPAVVYGAGDDVLRSYRVSWVTTDNNGLYGV